MRLRFSLRTLLVLTVLVAGCCYWWIMPPVVVANRFARAIEAQDYNAADALCVDPNPRFVRRQIFGRLAGGSSITLPSRVKVDFHPRQWHDIWQRQQHLTLRVVQVSPLGYDKTQSFGLIATPAGVLPEPDPFPIW